MPVIALLDDEAGRRVIESMSEAEVLASLRDTLADPTRIPRWVDAARAAWSAADVEAMARVCAEPERTASFDEASRRSTRELAAALVEPALQALRSEPTLVALDACVVVGATGVLEGLRARGLELTPLAQTE